ncbi:MAG: YbaN family protein [Bdellovibrionaceae bacterium]|nr:YbaN family protein [Pseudobdellovibrionaceae bacterium]MBX3033940.1 YbaN family protein [Pseudobdellovibrionaceae bacterium]
MIKKTRDLLFIAAGFLFLVIGIIGIALPVLPTTPFLLVAAYCFSRGSRRFHDWLIHHPRLGPPIVDWQRHRVIRRRAKVIASLMMAATAVFLLSRPNIPPFGKGAAFSTMLAALVFIWSRKEQP